MVKKLWNFIKTHNVNRYIFKYFYVLFLDKSLDSEKVLKLMSIRKLELEVV